MNAIFSEGKYDKYPSNYVVTRGVIGVLIGQEIKIDRRDKMTWQMQGLQGSIATRASVV